jgi:hypothetical protein
LDINNLEIEYIMSSFSIKSLSKTHPSLTRSYATKYYISCSDKITPTTPTTEDWLRIMDRLCLPDDKSHILLGSLEKYGEIIVKVGDSDDIIKEDYYSNLLKNTTGFIKYICAFECAHDFRRLKGNEESICKGPGSSMKFVLIPYFPMGSIASYKWTNDNIHILRTSLKHAFLSIMAAFRTHGFIHGDLHTGNILLKKTRKSSITYSIPGMEEFDIPTNGVRTLIMDFENSSIAKNDTPYKRMVTFNNYYHDIIKLLTFLLMFNKTLDARTICPIQTINNTNIMQSKMLAESDIRAILGYIDKIEFLSEEA